jgi:hypothetical protein
MSIWARLCGGECRKSSVKAHAGSGCKVPLYVVALSLVCLALVACGPSDEDIRWNANHLGSIDLQIDRPFGYWRQALAGLPTETGRECFEGNAKIVNCQNTLWGKGGMGRGFSGGLASASFMTSPGNESGMILGPTVSDSDQIVNLSINLKYLRVTFCGESLDKVRASGKACGYDVTFYKDELIWKNPSIRQ